LGCIYGRRLGASAEETDRLWVHTRHNEANNLRICLELQALPGGHVSRCSSVQEGGETDGLPRLVNALCEVRDVQCRDNLLLVQWVSFRHGLGLSSARDHPVNDYWTPSSAVCNPCGKGSNSLVCWRCVYGRLLTRWIRESSSRERSYPAGNGAGLSSSGGEGDADGGESIGLTRKLLSVT
jgi:hypothetical protein